MKFRRGVLASLALAASVLLAGAIRVRAEDACQKRTAKADHKLHEAIEHHGWQSAEAQHWRHELAEARAYCWDHSRRWWDEDARRWHSHQDWDDHDHDSDLDHH
jgi:hypothetical protein